VALCVSPIAAQADVGAGVTIASGLANPRGIAFAPNGALYVAESGRGGPGPCIPSPVAPAPRCFGLTGSIARILPEGGFVRTATGLPSLALPNGSGEGGPAKLSFHGMTAYVTMTLGGDPDIVRPALGGVGDLFGTLLRVTPSGDYEPVADIAANEAVSNPAGGAIDTNPYGVLALPGRRIVADAGSNALVEARANGSVRTFAVPPLIATPPGPPGGRETVPTAIVEGPDGALYVGLLTSAPWFPGTSPVLRVSRDGSSITTYATGFTAVVDIAFDAGGALYVLEVASGLVPPNPNPGLGAGRLKRQCPGGSPVVLLDGLTFPGGVAIGADAAAYITNQGTSPTTGEVLRLPLTPCT
jgi:hypothetical protein